MAYYFIKNPLNPSKVVKCNVTLRQWAARVDGGELTWMLQVETAEPHKNGGLIAPEFVRLVTLKDLDSELRKTTESIASKIDWGVSANDVSPPFVVDCAPLNGSIAGILSNVVVELRDAAPAAGLDFDSIEVSVNGFDVTGEVEIHGDPFECKVVWRPGIRVRDYY